MWVLCCLCEDVAFWVRGGEGGGGGSGSQPLMLASTTACPTLTHILSAIVSLVTIPNLTPMPRRHIMLGKWRRSRPPSQLLRVAVRARNLIEAEERNEKLQILTWFDS